MTETENVISKTSNETQRPAYSGLYNRVFKRIFDIVFASVFVILLVPVYLVVTGAIVIETGFPVFYRADRGGYLNRSFKIFKFRSMVKNADRIGGGTTALNDKRITRVGRFLRNTKLDEIPQLLNILMGEMSFIGPRPELLQYTSQYNPEEQVILQVRPGITDYSSITFINLDEIVGQDNADDIYEKYVLANKNQLRIKYALTVSPLTDLTLLFRTVIKVVHKIIKTIFHIRAKEARPWNT